MKIYLAKNVFEAAQERISWIFDEFENIVVSFSGGKDSTVILELSIMEARKRGRLPINVLFVDQECEWQATIDYVESLLERTEEIKLWWIQLPFHIENASSFIDHDFYAWGEGEEWIRPKHPAAVTENIFGEYWNAKNRFNDFYTMFDKILPVVSGGDVFANIYGLRAEESPHRRLAMTKLSGKYKGIHWTVSQAKGWRFGPIYDWTAQDVWTAIGKNGWKYNRNYDDQYRFGLSPAKMRVSSLTHGVASVHSLKVLQELEPQTYEALVRRMPGINTYSRLEEDIKVKSLPSAFATWKEYLDYLLANLIDEKTKEKFEELFYTGAGKRIEDGEDKWREFCYMVQSNDFLGVGMGHVIAAKALREWKDRKKGRRENA